MKKSENINAVRLTGIILAAAVWAGSCFSYAAGSTAGRAAENQSEETIPETETEIGGRIPESFQEAGLSDGVYEFDGTLEGGSGRASFDGPLTLTVKDGEGSLTFTMSSDHYDYVIVKGKKYEPVNKTGNSVFTVPIDEVNVDFSFIGDTTAMSRPYEIEYSVRISAEELKKADTSQTEGETESEMLKEG